MGLIKIDTLFTLLYDKTHVTGNNYSEGSIK